MVAEHPNVLVRDQYLMEVADRCRVEPDRLRELARTAEAVIRQIVYGLKRFVALEIDRRTGVQHEAFDALLRKDVRHHASRGAGADD